MSIFSSAFSSPAACIAEIVSAKTTVSLTLFHQYSAFNNSPSISFPVTVEYNGVCVFCGFKDSKDVNNSSLILSITTQWYGTSTFNKRQNTFALSNSVLISFNASISPDKVTELGLLTAAIETFSLNFSTFSAIASGDKPTANMPPKPAVLCCKRLR